MANLYEQAAKNIKKEGTLPNKLVGSNEKVIGAADKYEAAAARNAARERRAAATATVPAAQTAVSAATSPSQAKTTYIDANGEKQAGVVGSAGTPANAAPQQSAAQTWGGYWDDRGRYHTTILGADGNKYSGYIYNDISYYDNGERLAVGDRVVGADGTIHEMTPDKTYANPNLSNAMSDEFQEWLYDENVGKNAFSIHNDYEGFLPQHRTDKYGQDVSNGAVTIFADGSVMVSDGFQNVVGRFDSHGTWHPANEGTGDTNDALFNSWEDTARAALKAAGHQFTGYGEEWKQKQYGEPDTGKNGAVVQANGAAHYDEPMLPPNSMYSDAKAGTTPRQAVKETTPGTPTQSKDMMADEEERRRQAQEEAEAAERKRQEQIRDMTPEDNASLKQLEDQLATVDELLEKARAANDEAYAQQLEQIRLRIQTQIDSLNEQYEGVNRQLYVDYMMGRRDLPQQLSAMGYTGGLRESSLLNLQNNYEGQLAENERSRIAGNRDIESSGLDRELTIGIERTRANQQAEEEAYNRRAAIKEQMLAETNRIEDLSREDSRQARQEAQQQIDAYLEAGGSAAEIPPELLQISGYSAAYINAMERQYSQAKAQKEADAILKAGGTISKELAEAAGYDMAYTEALDVAERKKRAAAQVDAILAAGGHVPTSLVAEAGYSLEYVKAMEAARNQETASQAGSLLKQKFPPLNSGGGTGYSTAYADALSGTAGGGTQAKPVLTVTQVNDAIKKGIMSDQVLQAYEYYYGVPYQQAAPPYTPYYTPPVTPPPVTPTDENGLDTTPETEPPAAVKVSDLVSDYQTMLDYAESYAASGAMTPGQAREQIINHIVQDVYNKGLDDNTAAAIFGQLGI